jgi:hypothetical protein
MDPTQALLEKLGQIDASGFSALAEVLQAAAGQVPVMKEMTALEYSEHLVTEVNKFNAEKDAGRKATRLKRIQQSMAVVEKFKGAERVPIPVFTDAGLPAAVTGAPAAPTDGQSSVVAPPPAALTGQPSGDPANPDGSGDAAKGDGQSAAGSSTGKTLGQRLDEALANMEKEIAGLNVAAAMSPAGEPAPDGVKPPATVAGGEGGPGKADPPSEGDNAGNDAGSGADAGSGDGAGDAGGTGDGESDGDGAGGSEGADDAATVSASAEEWPEDLNHPPSADEFGKDPAATA